MKFSVALLCSVPVSIRLTLCFLLTLGGAFHSVRAEAMLQLFNLSWNQVAEKIPEIAEAGYSSLWLPPPPPGPRDT